MKPLTQHWLMKTEPSTYSVHNLARDRKTPWEGVRNYQARNFMRDAMQPGDGVLLYHSNTKEPGVYGIAKVCSAPYPDKTQFDPQSPYYDPKATIEKPRWFLVDVCIVRVLKIPVTLAYIKNHPRLREMVVAQKGSRLSVQPVSKEHFKLIAAGPK